MPIPKRSIYFPIWTCLLLGCGRDATPSRKDGAQPLEPADIEQLLEKGGERWSSAIKEEVKDGGWIAGDRFWVWPANDGPFVKEGKLTLPMKWRLRPGQKPPAPNDKDIVLGELRYLPSKSLALKSAKVLSPTGRWETRQAMGGGYRADLSAGAESGEFSFAWEIGKDLEKGEGWLLFYMAPENATAELLRKPKTALSNLIRIKVRIE